MAQSPASPRIPSQGRRAPPPSASPFLHTSKTLPEQRRAEATRRGHVRHVGITFPLISSAIAIPLRFATPRYPPFSLPTLVISGGGSSSHKTRSLLRISKDPLPGIPHRPFFRSLQSRAGPQQLVPPPPWAESLHCKHCPLPLVGGELAGTLLGDCGSSAAPRRWRCSRSPLRRV